MFTNDEHDDILNAAVEAAQLTISTSLGRPIRMRTGTASTGGDVVTVNITRKPLVFAPAVRATMSASFALSAADQFRDRMLVTSRLTSSVMDVCRRFGICCIDTDGNVFLRWADGVIDIAGRPAQASRTFAAATGRSLITGRSGLQLLFVLLSFPDLLNASVRKLAACAEISVGSVSKVLGELQAAGQLREIHGERSLDGRAELSDVFVDGYQRRLHRRLSLGTFSAPDASWWTTAKRAVHEAGGQWGGESALWLEQRMRPARGIVYLDDLPPSLMMELRMRNDPSPAATAEFRRRFWHVDTDVRRAVVPPLLVYSDLVADGDPRLLEAAADLRANSPDVFGR